MYNPQLETFLRVADAGSFNRAAEEAYITPTAVIKQINLLEESLDVKLFERTHRGLTLTKAGKFSLSGYKIYYTVLQRFCDTGKKYHAGGCQCDSYRNLSHDSGTAFNAIMA